MRRDFLFYALLAIFLFPPVCNASDTVKSYKIVMDDKFLSISTVTKPDSEFVTYKPYLSMKDPSLFKRSNVEVGLQLNWTYSSGITSRVDGLLEMRVALCAVKKGSISTSDGLEKQLADIVADELEIIEYKGAQKPIVFDKIKVNERSWLAFKHPVLGGIWYSTPLSVDSFLVISFDAVRNSDNREWLNKADILRSRLMRSVEIGEVQ